MIRYSVIPENYVSKVGQNMSCDQPASRNFKPDVLAQGVERSPYWHE